MTVTNFLDTELVNYASYSTLRAIASCIDGQKNAARKVIYTVQNKVKNDIKVEILSGTVAVNSEYLHGPSNLNGVIVGLAQDFAGTNNIPLLTREGIFGCRFEPNPSAARYIYTNKEYIFDKLFLAEDDNILIEQYFEGVKIEPKFYIPTLPLLLINGSEGIATGFAQKILPRNPKNIIKYIEQKLTNKTPDVSLLKPWFRGFKGTVEATENKNQYIINGVIEKISLTKLKITEIPLQYSLTSYTEVLDDLEDRKIIRSYRDLSQNDNFIFEIEMDSKTIKESDTTKLLNLLKLTKTVTENFTCINELNRVEEYTSPEEIIEHFLRVKSEYMNKRKEYLLMTMSEKLNIMKSKYIFLKAILDEKLSINKKSKKDISQELSDIKGIILVQGSYDYLINLPIHSLSQETFEKLIVDLKKLKAEYDEYKDTTSIELYSRDISEISKIVANI